MIETIVIRKSIRRTIRVIRRVNVNQFDLSAKPRFQRVQCQQVVPLDE